MSSIDEESMLITSNRSQRDFPGVSPLGKSAVLRVCYGDLFLFEKLSRCGYLYDATEFASGRHPPKSSLYKLNACGVST